SGGVTFAEDVAPLVFDRCVPCHHPGGSAPFSLLSYQDVKRRARLIASVTAERSMPPWRGVSEYGEFVGQKRLSETEIAVIQEWVGLGSPSGDLDAAPTATWTTGWQLGQPDAVVS